MYISRKQIFIYITQQTEDKTHRYDYSNTQTDLVSGIIGSDQNIKESR